METTVVNVHVKDLRKAGFRDLKHWQENPNHVYIGRAMQGLCCGSKWQNPYKIRDGVTRDDVIHMYREYVTENATLMADIESLRGKTLGCWCKPEACHGDVLASLLKK